MAIVADYCVPKEKLQEITAQIAGALRRQDETFRNVRLNWIKWVSDSCVIKEQSSFARLLMKQGLEDYEAYEQTEGKTEKSVDELFRQLKLFYARSKIILVITEGKWQVHDREQTEAYLHPFLGRKMLFYHEGRVEKFSL